MKRIIAVCLITVSLFPVLEQMAVVCLFSFNRPYIERQICEKRNLRNNCCKGLCFLKKNLNTAEENTPKNTLQFRSLDEMIWFYNSTEIQLSLPSAANRNWIQPPAARLTKPGVAEIFHPPGRA